MDSTFDSAKARELADLRAARSTAMWGKAVAFLRKELEPVKADIQAAISKDTKTWCAEYHFVWGIGVRNLLRTHGFAETDMGVQNLDNIYVPLVEEAINGKEW